MPKISRDKPVVKKTTATTSATQTAKAAAETVKKAPAKKSRGKKPTP